MESVTLVTEPLLHRDFVQFEIVVPILERLSRQYDITLAAPCIAPEVRAELERRNIRAADGGARFPPIRRPRDEIPSYVVSWARDTIWGLNRRAIERVLKDRSGIRINLSMTTAIDADVWLIQSRPLGLGIDAMRQSVNLPLRVALSAANPFVGRLDLHHLLDAGRRVRERYTTTHHVADWFDSKGLPVKGVMPMYYRPTIRRTGTNPSRDFILVYVGKECDSAALRMLLETGLPVTMFGSKSASWVMKSLRLERYPNARLLGYVSDDELSALYSNARFTAFPFTEEPFGLIPLESMACGSPVLTYGEQGPGESVLDGRTGWLVHSREEFVRRAVEIWNAGPPSSLMVERCQERAKAYHLETVREGWHDIIESAFEYSGEGGSPTRPKSWARPEPAFGDLRSAALWPPDSGTATRPTVPIEGLLTASPSVQYRSGGYFDTVESGPNERGTEFSLGENYPKHPSSPEGGRGPGRLRSSVVVRRPTADPTRSVPP
jgi:glycosyltransferase involved in cell wall biosynthesis